MNSGIFVEISLVLAVATFLAGFMQLLRQPIIISYIITGVLVGPSVLNLVHSTETFELFSRIGVALLLFIIGLGLNPRVIREVGKTALATGLSQIVVTSVVGFGICRLLGFNVMESFYMGVALSFSSTIIILKLLSDKKELGRLYGKIATGFLLVQDLVAVLLLIFVTAFSEHKQVSLAGLALSVSSKGILFSLVLAILAIYVLPRLSNFFARSQEFLFLFSIGWGLGVAALCTQLGFSIEIGALAAGVSLAMSPYSFEISSRMRPLRDFFLVIFFIVLGSSLTLANLASVVVPALLLALFVLIGNPIILMLVMGALGYRKKTSFKVALTVAQISEFSLILILIAHRAGYVHDQVTAIMTLVGLITIGVSTYMILYSDKLYELLESLLSVFERQKIHTEQPMLDGYEIIIFGYIAGSDRFVKTFQKMKKKFLVVDYDPETIEYLQSQRIPSRYGDANDPEFLNELNLEKVKLAIINIADFATNKLIVTHTRYRNKNAVIIAMNKSDKLENSLELYEDGASYVLMPHHQSTARINSIIQKHGIKNKSFEELKHRHTKTLLKEMPTN